MDLLIPEIGTIILVIYWFFDYFFHSGQICLETCVERTERA